MDKTKIIVVEDNIVYCEFVCNLLAREGFRTVQAFRLSTAKKLLQQATENDIIVSDLRLPEGDGIDLLRWMRKEGMRQPFIIMTDYAEVHTAVESIKLGSMDYIPKQLVEDKLVPLIRSILKERSQAGQRRMPVFAREGSAFQENHAPHKAGSRHRYERDDISVRTARARSILPTCCMTKSKRCRQAICGGGLRFTLQRACTVGFLRTRQRCIYRCGQCQERIFP